MGVFQISLGQWKRTFKFCPAHTNCHTVWIAVGVKEMPFAVNSVWMFFESFESIEKCQLTTSGTWSNDDNSSWSSIDVFGCTRPPWLLSTVYDPTKTLLATVWRKTSTFNTSPIISSVSYDWKAFCDSVSKCRIPSYLNDSIEFKREACMLPFSK